MSSLTYTPEKLFFTDEDFATMGWHDNPVRALAFGREARELSLDIDYIFKWEEPLPEEKHYRFWISPATLVFEDVLELSIQHEFYCGLTLLGIEREEYKKEVSPIFSKKLWKWKLDCVEGGWDISASGFRQFIRRPPVLVKEQGLDLADRGGYSFECPKRPNKALEPTPGSVTPRATEGKSK